MQNEMQEYPAGENVPSTPRTTPLMNIPAAHVVNTAASAARPKDVDPTVNEALRRRKQAQQAERGH